MTPRLPTSRRFAFFWASQGVPACECVKLKKKFFLIIENIRASPRGGRQNRDHIWRLLVSDAGQWEEAVQPVLMSEPVSVPNRGQGCSCAGCPGCLLTPHLPRCLRSLCGVDTHPRVGLLWGSSLEWGYPSSLGFQSAPLGLEDSTPGPLLDGSSFIGHIDFLFICEGTEYKITK